MIRWLIRCFLAGLFTILPLVITVAIVIWVGEYLNGWLGPGTTIGRRLEGVGLNFADSEAIAYTIGWVHRTRCRLWTWSLGRIRARGAGSKACSIQSSAGSPCSAGSTARCGNSWA